jgi:PAS domain S-box-containing protein
MSEVQYPFIDVAVHDRVSGAFAAGMAVALFTSDLRSICWANGRGAALFGFTSIYDFLDQGPDRAELMFRQVETVARALRAVGDKRSFTIRIPSGFSRIAVQANCEMIRVQGRPCILLAVPVDSQNLSLKERASRLIEGFDDAETHMAVLDRDGAILAASGEFEALAVPIQTTRMLVSMVDKDRHRLIKRPIGTAEGYLPAAIGKLSDDPALNLLLVVGLTKKEPAEEQPSDDSEESLPAAAGEDAYEDALAAISAIEDNLEVEEEIAIEEPVEQARSDNPADGELSAEPADGSDAVAADTPDGVAASADVVEAEEDDASERLVDAGPVENPVVAVEAEIEAHQDELPVVSEPSSELPPEASQEVSAGAQPRGEDEEPSTVAAASARPLKTVRFVWKIDASGRFSEVSREFAEAVGPHAADITGMAFSDLAALFNLDPEGKVTELLGKRDTWSGKTIWWPVEGTSLVVPVDLAALPTYTRTREFDGFRGFGIVRLGDAEEDPQAAGLAIGAAPQMLARADGPAEDTPLLDHVGPDRPDEALVDETVGQQPMIVEEISFDDQDAGEISGATEHDDLWDPEIESSPLEGRDLLPADADADEAAEDDSASAPASPAPVGSVSSKVIMLEERRSRLSPGEQAAFQEIGRRLDTFTKNGQESDDTAAEDTGNPDAQDAPQAVTTIVEPIAIAPEQDPHSLLTQRLDEPSDPPLDPEQDLSPVSEPKHAGQNQAEDQADEEALTDGNDEGSTDPAIGTEDVWPTDDELPPSHVIPSRDRPGLSVEIVDQMPVALLVHAGDRLIYANGEFLKLTGYPSLEVLADVGGLDALLQRQELEDKTSEAGGMVVVRADDVIVPVTARLQSIRWGESTALMLALMPVTVAPEADEQEDQAREVIELQAVRAADQVTKLHVEVEELRAILETATDGVVIIGSDSEIRSMNRSASALFNFDAEEINGKPFVTLFAHESQRAIIDYLGGLAGHGVASVLNDGREVIGREASGGFIPLFMTIGRLTSSNGYCAVIRDITQWKRTEEELRTAKRAAETSSAHKSEFLAHVSHEIRTPLNAIIGFADMMATERLGPIGHPRYIEYAGDIGRSGRHVLDIVNDLLDISKIEAGELDLDFVAVGLNDTVSEAVSLVQPQANGQRVIIRTALSQAVPDVVADLRSIKQIVLNILSNAIRFTPSGGQIVVSTAYEANGSVVLRIRDTGIGMSRSELELAMKPFRQVAGTSRNRGDGTGLGLPLTKAMVDANRATFAITSAPNEGTLVEITFPSQRVLAS